MSWFRGARASGDDAHRPGTGDPFAVSDDVVASALDDLEAGLTPFEILKRYPGHEDELGPLVETAYALRTTRWPAMSMAGRVAGRERLHAALAQQKRPKVAFLPPIWRQIGVSAALMLMAGAAFLASPYSPLDSRDSGAQPTATLVVPVMVEPTAAFSVELPAPSPTTTPTRRPTSRPEVTVEPSETAERIVFAESTPAATATATVTPTLRSRTTRPRPATLTPTAAAVVVIAPTETSQGSEAAQATQPPPAPTLVPPPTSTPSPAQPRPSATRTVAPTLSPEPTWTPTVAPLPTNTRTPGPTVQPSSTVRPSATPKPTETDRPRPRLSQTPEPTRTPKRTSGADGPAIIIKGNEPRPHPASQAVPGSQGVAGRRGKRP